MKLLCVHQTSETLILGLQIEALKLIKSSKLLRLSTKMLITKTKKNRLLMAIVQDLSCFYCKCNQILIAVDGYSSHLLSMSSDVPFFNTIDSRTSNIKIPKINLNTTAF